jgi:ribosome-associated protein
VRNRFLEQNATKLTVDGEIVISSDRFRDQKMNTDDCIDRLKNLLQRAAVAPKARKKTKPSKGSQRRNETAKRTNKEKKQNRGRVKF